MAGWPTVVIYCQSLPTRTGRKGVSLGVHTSSGGVGGFTSGAADASAVAAKENLWAAAGFLDALVTRWWSATVGRGCGCGEDERSDKYGDQRCEEHHRAWVKL